MALPDTTNTAAIYVDQVPAWEMGLELMQTMTADVQTARSGLEQRQARTTLAKYRMSYQAHLDASQRAARLERMLLEVQAPLWVPWWPKGAQLVEDQQGSSLQLDREADPDFHEIGGLVFLWGAETGFGIRTMKSYEGTVARINRVIPGPQWKAGDYLFPYRLCIRDAGSGEFKEDSEATHIEKLTYRTL